jgi:hypothetical protein
MSPRLTRVRDEREGVFSRVRLFMKGKEVRVLALRAERAGRALNGLEPVEDSRADAVAVLESACDLLERAARAEKPAPTRPATVASEPDAQRRDDQEPSATVRELIAVRDVVLVALEGAQDGPREVLEGIYRSLGKVLEREDVSSVEALGAFDPAKHEVLDTRPTSDPNEDEVVCETIRPGYSFRGRLIRPQEVVVYQFERGRDG